MDDNCVASSQLIQEWDFSKNTLDPQATALGSNKKAWWKCVRGHEWSAVIGSRGAGVGCPYCANRRITTDNNLAARFPELVREWDTERNRVAATSVFPGSVKKFGWICPKGHSYQVSPNKRTSRGAGCPYCSRRRTSELNSLALAFPQLAVEFHPTKNAGLVFEDLSVKSHRQIWWQCKRGHEWEAIISNRTRGNGCPYCNSQVSQSELRIYAELTQLFDGVRLKAKVNRQECDILVEPLNFAIEYDGSYWHRDKADKDAEKNRRLAAAGVTLVRVREIGLDKIGPHDFVVTPDNPSELYDTVRAIVALIAGRYALSPAETERVQLYLASTGFQNDEEYRALLARLPSPLYENSLEARYPELVAEWHPVKNKTLTPADLAMMSGMKVWWRCAAGHEWESSVGNRTNAGNSCPYCAHQIITLENSLAAKRPDLVAEWDAEKNGLAADEVFAFTSKRYWWRCAKGHEWQANVSNRASTDKKKNTGCPFCANKKANAENCLATTHSTLTAEWHPDRNGDLSPHTVTQGSYKKVWWKCARGHEWLALISSRSKGRGCPYCVNQKVSTENSLATLFPGLALEWHPARNGSLTPEEVVPGTSKKVWWQCAAGHEWEASVSYRSRLKYGCPYCAGRRATADNCLLTKNPALAAQWHTERNGNLTARDVAPKSSRVIWWQCANGHSWQAPVKARANRRYPCPTCRTIKQS